MKKSLILLSLILSLVILFSIAGCTPEKPEINEIKENDLVAEEKPNNQKVEGVKESDKTEETPKNKENNEKNEDTQSNKTEAPKVEEPKAEEPKAEEPKVEEPKAEEPPAKENPPVSEPKILTKDKAKDIALKSAGVKEVNIRDYEIELDREGKTLVYEISFKSGNTEYDYAINAVTGEIIKRNIDEESKRGTSSDNSPSVPNLVLTKVDVKKIALEDAGVLEKDIKDYECEIEKQGSITIYEISFESNKKEYDYKINAHSGAIIKAEKERD